MNQSFSLEVHMKCVTGMVTSSSRQEFRRLCNLWYKRHPGIDVQDWGGATFSWSPADGKRVRGKTIWPIKSAEDDSFAQSSASFMVNYRVEELHALVIVSKEEGGNIIKNIVESELGKFAWFIDQKETSSSLWSRLTAIERARYSQARVDVA